MIALLLCIVLYCLIYYYVVIILNYEDLFKTDLHNLAAASLLFSVSSLSAFVNCVTLIFTVCNFLI